MPIYIKQVTINQIGRFLQKTTFNFTVSNGCIGITGKNGTGKSTLISCILYALTGKVNRLSRNSKKEDIVNIYAKKDSSNLRPFVELLLEKVEGGETYQIVIKRPVEIGNYKESKKVSVKNLNKQTSFSHSGSTVNNFIKKDLLSGVDETVLSDLIFVEQGHITDIVMAPPSLRYAILARALGLRKLEKAVESVYQLIKKYSPQEGNTVLIDFLEKELDALQKEIESKKEKLESIKLLDDNEYDKIKKLCSEYERYKLKIEELKNNKTEYELIDKRLNQQFFQQKRPLPEGYEEILQLEQLWQEYEASQRELEIYFDKEKSLTDLITELQQKKEPDPLPEKPNEEQLFILKFRYDFLNEKKCPVCLGESDGRKFFNEKEVLTEFNILLNLHKNYSKLQQKYQIEKAVYQAAKEELPKKLEELQKLKSIINSKLKLKPNSPRPSKFLIDEIRENIRFNNSLENVKQNLLNDLQKLKSKIAKLESEIPKVTIQSEQEYIALRNRLDVEERNRKEIVELQKEINEKTLKLKSLQDRLKEIKNSEDFSVRRKEVYNALEIVCEILRKDKAPQKIINLCLKTINRKVNEILERLRSSHIRTILTEEGEFYTTVNNELMPWLSGGQNVILSLAWRLALSLELGFLCLDEPTYGLDKKRLSSLGEVVTSWKDYKLGQLFIVSHHKKLINSCDQIINLDEISA